MRTLRVQIRVQVRGTAANYDAVVRSLSVNVPHATLWFDHIDDDDETYTTARIEPVRYDDADADAVAGLIAHIDQLITWTIEAPGMFDADGVLSI